MMSRFRHAPTIAVMLSAGSSFVLTAQTASAQLVTRSDEVLFEFSEFDVDYGFGGPDTARLFIGAPFSGGNLFTQTFADPTGVVTDTSFEFSVDAMPDTRMGVEFFAETIGGTASSAFLSEHSATYEATVRRGQTTSIRLGRISENTVTNAGLVVDGPALRAGMDLIAEGGFTIGGRFADASGDTIVGSDGSPQQASIDLSLPGSANVFTVEPGGFDVNLGSLGPASFGLSNPEPVQAVGDITNRFENLPEPDGFRLGAVGTQDPFATVSVDIDEILASSVGASITGGIPGVSFEASPFGVSATLGSDPFSVGASLDLLDLPLNAGISLRNEYELVTGEFEYSNFRLTDDEGLVLTGADAVREDTNGDLIYDFTIPNSVQDGDLLSILVDVDQDADLEAITQLVGNLTGEISVLSASLDVAGVSVFEQAFFEGSDPLLQTRPFELSRQMNSLDGVYETATLKFDLVVVPTPGTLAALLMGGSCVCRRKRS